MKDLTKGRDDPTATDITEIQREDTDWIHLALDSSRHANQPSPFRTSIEFLGQANDVRLLKASDLLSLLVSHSARRMVKWNLKRH